MEFSSQQLEALRLIDQWIIGPEQLFYLAGYAGTGKTTIAREIGANFYVAFTGKAAQVLASKGCRPARTIHSLIYQTQSQSTLQLHELLDKIEAAEKLKETAKPTELKKIQQNIEDMKKKARRMEDELKRPFFVLNLDSELDMNHLLVVDECSMVDEQMGRDILSFGSKVLVLGDPAQLPPVFGQGYFTDREPDYTLTEIHRQARGNPILDLATYVRTNGRMPETSPLMVNGKVTPDIALQVDQIIVGRNRTRHSINNRMRQLKGFTDPLPVAGDRVVCMRNNHDIGVMNGQLFTVDRVLDIADEDTQIIIELRDGPAVCAHKAPFLGEKLKMWEAREAEHFEYGYAITCHKSQGSQWDSVLLFDESSAFREDSAKWLYTAITRASKDLLIA